MRRVIFSIATMVCVGIVACNQTENQQSSDKEKAPKESPSKQSSENEEMIKAGKGVGEIKEVELTEPLKTDMIETGEAIYNMKCASCHKLDDKRVVGPGWEGITNTRKPEWIMNMITNVDVMLEEDPEAQKLLEECLTRMPNQGVSTGDARSILEFMRENDEYRLGTRDKATES